MSFAAQIRPHLPTGVTLKTPSWYPGNEPLTEWKRLYWVEVSCPMGNRVFTSCEFYEFEQPTVAQALTSIATLKPPAAWSAMA